MNATTDISNSADLIDIRDVIARVEDLEGQADYQQDDLDELETLTALLEECKGNGGDEEWRGDWYPGTLIRDTYFKDYAQELAEDIGAIDTTKTYGWPLSYIDWDAAADALRMDYTAVEFDGVTYWTR